jgi:hypothetical protein
MTVRPQPTSNDVKDALNRIGASEAFRSKRAPFALLKEIVELRAPIRIE